MIFNNVLFSLILSSSCFCAFLYIYLSILVLKALYKNCLLLLLLREHQKNLRASSRVLRWPWTPSVRDTGLIGLALCMPIHNLLHPPPPPAPTENLRSTSACNNIFNYCIRHYFCVQLFSRFWPGAVIREGLILQFW